MNAALFIGQVEPLRTQVAQLLGQIDRLADAGVGQDSRDTLQAAGNALDAAGRLLQLAVAGAIGKTDAP